jgi:glycosyltransferase involved in cell wall biosynthesis
MRILHTNMLHGWGGQSNRILVEAMGAMRAGHEVALAAPNDAVLGVKGRNAGMIVWPGFEMRSPAIIWSFLSDLTNFRKQIEDWQPDIIHTHGSQDTWLAAIAKYRSKRRFPPIIRTKHNIFEWKSHRLNRWLYRQMDAFIGISGFIDAQLAIYPGIGDRPRALIPSVPDRAALEQPRPSLRGHIPGYVPGMYLWGSTGRLRAEKGFDVLLKAFARVRQKRQDVFLVIAGDGSDRSALEMLAAKLALGPDALCFLGFRNDVPAILQTLDGYVLTSRSEGLGTAILEALCVGLPVVATNVGGIPDSVRHEETGLLVPSEDDNATAEAMLRLMDDPELRTRLKAAAKQVIAREFNEERLVQQTLDFYIKVYRRHNLDSMRPEDGDKTI